MKSRVILLGAAALAIAVLSWARTKPLAIPSPQDEAQSWTGVVSDSNCGAKHSEASDEAAECVAKCVSNGAKYVLVSEGTVYQVEPQEKFSDFAGRAVSVTGSLKDGTITAESVGAANAEKSGDDSE